MSHLAPLLASSSDTATGVGIPLALAAGLVSFLSPCVLPLVPGYLSTVIGVTPADLRGRLGVRLDLLLAHRVKSSAMSCLSCLPSNSIMPAAA